jgi:tetratricopeptide (TPR) repeat protein
MTDRDSDEASDEASDVGASPGDSYTRLRASESALLRSSRSIVNSDDGAESEVSKGEDIALSVTRSSTTLTSVEKIIEDKASRLHTDALKATDPQSAILLLNRAVSLKPSIAQYYVARAEMFIHLCDFHSSILNLKKAQSLDPRNSFILNKLAFVHYFYGQVLFDQCLYADALDFFHTAARMKPDSVGYSIRSVTCLAALGRHGSCLDLVNRRLQLNEDNPDLYLMRAKLQQMFGNTTHAFCDITSSLKLDPNHPEAQKMMADFEEKAEVLKDAAVQQSLLGNLKEAVQKMTSAIQMNPTVASYHTLRGAVHRRMSNFEAATDDFLVSLDKCGDVGGTIVDLQTSREASRQLVLTYNDFAVECFTKRFYNEAVVLLNKAIKAEKEEKGLFINRGDCFYCMHELHYSLADYAQALELDPDGMDVHSRVSVIHCELGIDKFEQQHYKDATEHFTSSIEHNPCISRYYVCRAHSRYLTNDVIGAQEDVVLALLLEPGNDEASLLLQRLFPGQTLEGVVRKGLASRAVRKYKRIVTEFRSRENTGAKVFAIKDNETVNASIQDLAASLSFEEDGRHSHSLLSITDGYQGQVKASTVTVCDDSDSEDGDQAKEKEMAIVPLPLNVMPDLKACMKEHDFHSKIYYAKKRMDKLVGQLLHKREKLDCLRPKIGQSVPHKIKQAKAVM